MTIKRGGLGRGLGSLIPTVAETAPPARVEPGGGQEHERPADSMRSWYEAAPAAATSEPVSEEPRDQEGGLVQIPGAYFAELPITAVRPNPRQPRSVFDEDAMAELVHSIGAVGLLQPVVVRPLDDGAYELVMGERRWRACQAAGLDTVAAIVRETDDEAMLRDALLENLHRSELNPLEEAAAYRQLLDDFGCSHEELGQRLGRSRPQVSNTLRLLRLSAPVQRRVSAGVLSAGHARALLAVDDSEAQDRLAARVVAEGISVRGLEELVATGAAQDRPRAARRRQPQPPEVAEVADRLSERLDTRCTVEMGRRKGKISIEFATLADLQRIVAAMGTDSTPVYGTGSPA